MLNDNSIAHSAEITSHNSDAARVIRIQVDLQQILQIAFTGITRSAIFMGLGLNAAKMESFKDYELWKLTPGNHEGDVRGLTYGIVPDGASTETISHYKEEFGHWITNNCLRDLVETFAAYLDHIHLIGLLVFESVHKKLPDHETLQKAFHQHPGLGWKLRVLRERFDIGIEQSHLLESLYDARNCLSHRLGIVAKGKDCGPDGKLHVKWVGADLAAFGTESGKEFPVFSDTPFPEPVNVMMKFSEKTLSFREGEYIKIPHQALVEMCFFSTTTATQLITSLTAFIRKCGIPVEDIKPPQPATPEHTQPPPGSQSP